MKKPLTLRFIRKNTVKMIRLLSALLMMSASLITFGASNAPKNTDFSQDQINQIQKIVHNYLVKNPQVLVEASQALQQQQEQQMQSSAINAIKDHKKGLFSDKTSPSIGDKDAPVTIVEFFDYQCGHCKAMAPVLAKLVDSDKKIHVIFKELPIFGGNSKLAAKVALAAMKQNKYYELHNLLLNADGPLNNVKIFALAKKAKLNLGQIKKDMDSPAIKAELDKNFALAKALKMMGTPTFVIANKAQTKFRYIPGATSAANLKKQIMAVE